MPVENEERERQETEKRLEGLLGGMIRGRAPDGLWDRLTESLGPEARAARESARWRQRLVGGLVAMAASVLVAAGGWYWFAVAGQVTGPAVGTVAPPVVTTAPSAGAAQGIPTAVALLDREGETLGQVHVVYEASNFLPGEMVLVTAGEGYDN
jgi:hypothetical protein